MIEIVLIIILVAAFALTAWRDLKHTLILLTGLLPTYLIRFSIGPIPSTVLEILILTIFVVWFVQKKAWRINYFSIGTFLRPLLLVLAAASFAVIVADDTISAFGIWKAYFIEPAMVFLMMRSLFETRKDWDAALKALAISGIALSLFAIFQVITGLGIPVPWDLERRVTSVFEYPNALGLFLAPIVTLSIALLYEGKNKIFWASSAIIGLIAIILAQTESALVAIPAALVVTYLISGASKKSKWLVASCAIGAVVLLFAFVPIVREKILLQDYSGQVRLSQWYETYHLLQDHFVLGVGLNEYPNALKPYHDPKLYEIFQYPHNILLNIWVELGLLGLIAFFWLAWTVFKSVRMEKTNILKLALFAALVTMTIHGFVDVPYFKNDLSAFVWILLAGLSVPIMMNEKTRS